MLQMAHLQVGGGGKSLEPLWIHIEGTGRSWFSPKIKVLLTEKNKGDCIRMEITVGAHYAWTQRLQIPALA